MLASARIARGYCQTAQYIQKKIYYAANFFV